MGEYNTFEIIAMEQVMEEKDKNTTLRQRATVLNKVQNTEEFFFDAWRNTNI